MRKARQGGRSGRKRDEDVMCDCVVFTKVQRKGTMKTCVKNATGTAGEKVVGNIKDIRGRKEEMDR